jgi:cytoskeleton protein RodZ
MSELQEMLTEDKATITLEQFGARLKEMREVQGLTIKSVASDLRLSGDLITALENSDTANLPSKIFVMGYLRSYARLLHVDESELEQVDLSAIHHTVDVRPSFSRKPEKNSKHLSVRLVTYLITAGMLALLALWWLSMQTDITEIATVESYQETHVADTTLSLPQQSSEQLEPRSEESAPEPVLESVEQSVVVEQPVAETKPVIPEVTVIEEEKTVVATTAIAQAEITLTYLDDSWSEVSDASDSRLLYGLYKKGREVIIQGVAPFTLFFGYAPGVVVTYNGEQFEHIAFHRKGVARFQVGSAEDNHLTDEN